ncbi:hypothetical protein NBRC116601_15090 [Cognatishimia sp. WU-CL00825]|uniref:hypothetical protein n=1 Tax=Cognatishimia sp. WU-CL00825 TaxID=3127658 RepID=UPI003103F8CC
MKQFVHILISMQIIGWVLFMSLALLTAESANNSGNARGYLFLGIISMIVCFIPAMRYSYRYDRQPIAFFLAVIPVLVLMGVVIANNLTAAALLP